MGGFLSVAGESMRQTRQKGGNGLPGQGGFAEGDYVAANMNEAEMVAYIERMERAQEPNSLPPSRATSPAEEAGKPAAGGGQAAKRRRKTPARDTGGENGEAPAARKPAARVSAAELACLDSVPEDLPARNRKKPQHYTDPPSVWARQKEAPAPKKPAASKKSPCVASRPASAQPTGERKTPKGSRKRKQPEKPAVEEQQAKVERRPSRSTTGGRRGALGAAEVGETGTRESSPSMAAACLEEHPEEDAAPGDERAGGALARRASSRVRRPAAKAARGRSSEAAGGKARSRGRGREVTPTTTVEDEEEDGEEEGYEEGVPLAKQRAPRKRTVPQRPDFVLDSGSGDKLFLAGASSAGEEVSSHAQQGGRRGSPVGQPQASGEEGSHRVEGEASRDGDGHPPENEPCKAGVSPQPGRDGGEGELVVMQYSPNDNREAAPLQIHSGRPGVDPPATTSAAAAGANMASGVAEAHGESSKAAQPHEAAKGGPAPPSTTTPAQVGRSDPGASAALPTERASGQEGADTPAAGTRKGTGGDARPAELLSGGGRSEAGRGSDSASHTTERLLEGAGRVSGGREGSVTSQGQGEPAAQAERATVGNAPALESSAPASLTLEAAPAGGDQVPPTAGGASSSGGAGAAEAGEAPDTEGHGSEELRAAEEAVRRAREELGGVEEEVRAIKASLGLPLCEPEPTTGKRVWDSILMMKKHKKNLGEVNSGHKFERITCLQKRMRHGSLGVRHQETKLNSLKAALAKRAVQRVTLAKRRSNLDQMRREKGDKAAAKAAVKCSSACSTFEQEGTQLRAQLSQLLAVQKRARAMKRQQERVMRKSEAIRQMPEQEAASVRRASAPAPSNPSRQATTGSSLADSRPSTTGASAQPAYELQQSSDRDTPGADQAAGGQSCQARDSTLPAAAAASAQPADEEPWGAVRAVGGPGQGGAQEEPPDGVVGWSRPEAGVNGALDEGRSSQGGDSRQPGTAASSQAVDRLEGLAIGEGSGGGGKADGAVVGSPAAAVGQEDAVQEAPAAATRPLSASPPRSAILAHPKALVALKTVVDQHQERIRLAKEYMKRQQGRGKGRLQMKGAQLGGYSIRCGQLVDKEQESSIAYGCGTSLPDVHLHCPNCIAPQEGGEELDSGDDEETAHDKQSGQDYCVACVLAHHDGCPNPDCRSLAVLEPRDFLLAIKPCNSTVHDFAKRSKRLVSHELCSKAEEVARLNYERMTGALRGLDKAHMPTYGADTHMYQADVEVAKRHQLFANSLDQGVPVLMQGCGVHFEEEPFSAEAMLEIAESTWRKQNPVKVQTTVDKGGFSEDCICSLRDFFEPMLKGGTKKPDRDERLGTNFKRKATGFKLPDFGIELEEQSQAFFRGLDKLGIGQIARLDGSHNIAAYLKTSKDPEAVGARWGGVATPGATSTDGLHVREQDKDNGTQAPDLGPKFYIARPRIGGGGGKPADFVRNQKRRVDGATFTPLHCDLADAVNYSCSGEAAMWHIFHRQDRAKLIEYLGATYGREKGPQGESVYQGVEILWNPTLHRLLDGDDLTALARLGVKPWQFSQSPGEVVVLPAGCAHQVVNGCQGHNIKVAQDFIAPQSAQVSLELLSEMRAAKQEDKVQAPLTLRFAGEAALLELGPEDSLTS